MTSYLAFLVCVWLLSHWYRTKRQDVHTYTDTITASKCLFYINSVIVGRLRTFKMAKKPLEQTSRVIAGAECERFFDNLKRHSHEWERCGGVAVFHKLKV